MSNLNDIHEKKTPISFGENTMQLHYDMNAFVKLEEYFGCVDKALHELSEGKLKALLLVLWAGLLHENDALVPKDVGKMFDMSEIQVIAEVINEALKQAMPEQKEVDDKKKN